MVNTVVHSAGVVTPATPHKVQRKNAASNQSKQETKAKTPKKEVGEGHVDVSV